MLLVTGCLDPIAHSLCPLGAQMGPDGTFAARGDLSCVFYHLRAPECLEDVFSLPSIWRELVGVNEIDGVSLDPGTPVSPCLVVLPMGWSWVMHLRQAVVRQSLLDAGVQDHQAVDDGQVPPRLATPTAFAAAA